MGRKKRGIPGLSFSWKRATGISSAKGKLARATGIPTTRAGRQRKVGRAIGCLLPALLLLLLFTLGFTFQSKPQQWEYMTMVVPDKHDREDLQTFGSQGWELVAVRPYAEGISTNKFVLYFKRAKP